ncbi:hypothetical protein OSB04_022888 [Centaurea solstitialis]|uniref:Uncharacterized protein n=1 Tax=Centaurea solstitialis TaxID=347529 RepID=A0AA38SWE9_9ASTR|nr:hypothetical protein OSB04_022888 [Centaurea solstitialis]
MQSRLIAVSKLNRMLLYPTTSKYQTSSVLFSSAGGDPEMEDAMTQGVDTQGETNPHPEDHDHDDKKEILTKDENDVYRHPFFFSFPFLLTTDNTRTLVSTQSRLDRQGCHSPSMGTDLMKGPRHPKTVPLSSSKLETPGVNTPFDPHHQQKRTNSNSNSNPTKDDLSSCTCAGLDGSPWPEETDERKKEQDQEDDKHYFEHHKASPLSEIEIVDTRKPLTRVTDGTAGGYFGDEPTITWRPEQLETAEESLLRATRMFKEAAARGVPDWPHSRRLRQLRKEDW